MVNSSKEGNAAIGLAHNSYHLMHQASEKDFKTAMRWQMHGGLRGINTRLVFVKLRSLDDQPLF